MLASGGVPRPGRGGRPVVDLVGRPRHGRAGSGSGGGGGSGGAGGEGGGRGRGGSGREGGGGGRGGRGWAGAGQGWAGLPSGGRPRSVASGLAVTLGRPVARARRPRRRDGSSGRRG